MDRKTLESTAAHYPYLHVQGLFAVPAGLIWFLVALSNLPQQPVHPVFLVGGLLVCVATFLLVARYYADTYGRVVFTRSRQVRYFVALAGGFAVFVVVDQLARTILGRPPTQPVSTYASAWALGMLVFYASTVGLKAHHVVIWGALAVAGLLPIWGPAPGRDLVGMVAIGVATMASGVLDHRLLVRAFRSARELNVGPGNVGA